MLNTHSHMSESPQAFNVSYGSLSAIPDIDPHVPKKLPQRCRSKFERMKRLAQGVAICLSIVAAIGTAKGLIDANPHEPAWIFILLAAALGLTLAVAWHVLLDSAASTRTPLGTVGVLVGALLVVALAVTNSTWSIATGLGGDAALVDQRYKAVLVADLQLSNATSNIELQSSAEPHLRNAAAQFQALSMEEAERGGCGPLCNAQKRVAADFTQQADQIARKKTALFAVGGQASNALASARAAIADGPAFEAELKAAHQHLAVLAGADLTRAISFTTGIVDQDIPAVGLNKLSQIQNQLQSTLAGLKAGLKPVDLDATAYKPVSKSAAVVSSPALAAFALALGIDIAPFILLLLILCWRKEPLLRNAPAPRSSVAAISSQVWRDEKSLEPSSFD